MLRTHCSKKAFVILRCLRFGLSPFAFRLRGMEGPQEGGGMP